MLLKDHILKEIKKIDSPQILNQVFEYLQIVRQSEPHLTSNKTKVLQFAGLLSDKEAKKISSTINTEFNSIS